jgi:hypothetical protein
MKKCEVAPLTPPPAHGVVVSPDKADDFIEGPRSLDMVHEKNRRP